MKKLVVISGLSGAGKSTALGFFEDMGYFCMDNVPPVLLKDVYALLERGSVKGVAVVVDVRGEVFGDPVEVIKSMRDKLLLIFLEASTEEIVKRYSLTRRSHPLGLSPQDAVVKEKEMLSDLKEMADFVIDTTGMTHKELREKLREIFQEISGGELVFTVRIKSFGFKHGIPPDSDFVFDARFFPNPYYVPGLSEKTGLDDEVKSYMEKQQGVKEYVERIAELVLMAKEGYKNEGRSSLYVSIGCSGGRHRSVYIAEEVARLLRMKGLKVVVEHRDLGERT